MKDRVRAEWDRVVLVCRKCSKKLDGGFGPDGGQSLAAALRAELGGGKGRKAKAGVIEVGCLKICPKRAVVVVDAAHPREWLLVEAGAPVEAVVARLRGGDAVPADQAVAPHPALCRSPA